MVDIYYGLALTALILTPIAFVVMLIGYKQFTKGLWKEYTKWLAVAATLMAIYLLTITVASLFKTSKYHQWLLIGGFVAESFAALAYIKSSHLLNIMGNKFGFRHALLNKALKTGKDEKKGKR